MMMLHFHKFEGQGSEVRVHGHWRKNVAKVFGASSSEGFLVNADYLRTFLRRNVAVIALELPAEQQFLRTMYRRERSNTLPTVLVNVVQLMVAVDYRLYSRSALLKLVQQSCLLYPLLEKITDVKTF